LNAVNGSQSGTIAENKITKFVAFATSQIREMIQAPLQAQSGSETHPEQGLSLSSTIRKERRNENVTRNRTCCGRADG
jgi:hypothetical protein